MDELVLGGDLGGTGTRVLVVDREGAVAGRGAARGGNPVSNPETSAAAFAQALAEALRGIDPRRVRRAVVGVAGGGSLRDPQVRDRFADAWSGAGLTIAPHYRSDLEVAFAAGTAEPSGSVLIAGTGAVAGVIADHRLGRTADGHGWLLGDEGSGFWIGREAVRATLRSLDAGTAPGPLARSVLEALEPGRGDDDQRSWVIRAVYGRPPVRLADLAPLVTAAHADGDPEAGRIVEDAARLLAATLARVPTEAGAGPLVLAGSLTRPTSPVGVGLRKLLADGAEAPRVVATATDEVAGAAWLALLDTGPAALTTRTWRRLTRVTISDRSDS